LVETTDMKFADVAFAAGFSSVRQFNETVKDIFAMSPRELRNRVGKLAQGDGDITVRLPFRSPIAAEHLRAWFQVRTIRGLQRVEGDRIVRSLRLPNGPGSAELAFDDGFVRCQLRLHQIADLASAVERCRRLLDLDADPVIIDAALAEHKVLRAAVRKHPGLRSPGSVDGFETAIFGLLGQQISVKAACGLAARLVERHGSETPHPSLTAFPAPTVLIDADLDDLGMTKRTQSAIRDIAQLVAAGLSLDPGSDRHKVRHALLGVRGVGTWTADYIALRALRDPDVLPVGDLMVRRGAEALGLPADAELLARAGAAWSPWRTYATHHLWINAKETSRA